jgi:hypothetical protein
MMRQLKRPCANCPFRADIPPYLRGGRVREIERGARAGHDFHCHRTIKYDTEDGRGRVTADSERCAGFAIVLEKEGLTTQMMRIEERIGTYDPGANDMGAPVYDSFAEMEAAQHD